MGIKSLIESGDIEVWDDVFDVRFDDKAAPDLSDILKEREESTYSDPEEFFKRTYVTKSLNELIEEVAEVLKNGKGGRIFLLTSLFGGGKTHTLISLYHAFKNPERIRTISNELSARVAEVGKSTIIILDGSRASLVPHPDEPYRTEGFTIKTIWGMLAYRLGAYAKIKHLDSEVAAAPDVDLLKIIFSEVKEPVLILMDEIVHYVFNMVKSRYRDYGEKVLLFLDYLGRAVESSPKIALIVSVQAEYRIIEGQKQLVEEEIFAGYARKIFNLLSRESTRLIVPVVPEDVIKVLQRRIFKKVSEDEARKAMNKLYKTYRENQELFGVESDWQYSPSEEGRIATAKDTYPFHQKYIEVLQEFVTRNKDLQKTRDAIRITRKVVRRFLKVTKEDADFIMPWHIDLRDNDIRSRVLTDSRKEFRDVANRDICTEEGQLGSINECSKPMLAFKVATAVLLKTYTYETFKEPLKVFPDLKNIALMVYDSKTFALEGYQPSDIETILEEMLSRLPHFASENKRYWFTPYPSVLEYVEKRASEKFRDRGLELYQTLKTYAEGILLREERRKERIADQGEIFNRKNTKIIGYLEDIWREVELEDKPSLKLVVFVKPEVSREEVEKIILMKGEGGRRVFRNTIAAVAPSSGANFDPLLMLAAKIKAAEEVKSALNEYYTDREIRSLQEGKLKKYIQDNGNLLSHQLLATLTKIAYPTRGEAGDEVRWVNTAPSSSIISQVEQGLKDPSTGPKLRTDFHFNDLVEFLKRNQNWDLVDGVKRIEFREIVNVFYTNTVAPFTTQETIERVILSGVEKNLDIGIEMDGVLYWKRINEEGANLPSSKLKENAEILPFKLAAESLKEKLLAESGLQKIGDKIHKIWYEVEIGGKRIKLENLVTEKGWEKVLKQGKILKQVQVIERGLILKITPSSLTIKPGERAEVKVDVSSIEEYQLEVQLKADKGRLSPDRGKLPLNATWDIGILDEPGEYKFTIEAKGLDESTQATLIVSVPSREVEIMVEKLEQAHRGGKLIDIIPKNLISLKMALDIASKLNLKSEVNVEMKIGENISFSGIKMDLSIAGLFIQKFADISRAIPKLQDQISIIGAITPKELVVIDDSKITAFIPLAERALFKLRVERSE